MNKKFVVLTVLLVFIAHEIIGAAGRAARPLAAVKKDKAPALKNKELAKSKVAMEAGEQVVQKKMDEILRDDLVQSMPMFKALYKETYDKAGNFRLEPYLEYFRDCIKGKIDLYAASWEEGLKICSQDLTDMVGSAGEELAAGQYRIGYLALAEEKGDRAAAEKMDNDLMSEKYIQDIAAGRDKYRPQVLEFFNKVIATVKAEGPSSTEPIVAEVFPGAPAK